MGNVLVCGCQGWIKTFERYFEEQTRNILNLMVEKLEQYPQMRFIYAEMSFFSLWWRQINPVMRQRVKKLVGFFFIFISFFTYSFLYLLHVLMFVHSFWWSVCFLWYTT